MAKTKDEIVRTAINSWKQKDKTNEFWFKAIVEGAWNSGYKRGMDDAIEVEKAKHLWIPVTERLPKENGFYLCLYKHKHPGGVAIDEGLSIVQMYKGKWNLNEIYAVTHWMPLPEPLNINYNGENINDKEN